METAIRVRAAAYVDRAGVVRDKLAALCSNLGGVLPALDSFMKGIDNAGKQPQNRAIRAA